RRGAGKLAGATCVMNNGGGTDVELRASSHVQALLVGVVLVILGSQVIKAGELTTECQATGTDRAVTLLADNHLGNALLLRLLVVHLIAIQEHDQVGVLLD